MIIEPNEWLWALVGGVIIGLAATSYLLINGRIMGASGILGSMVDRSGWIQAREQLAFLAGLVIVPGIMAAVWFRPETNITSNVPLIIAGGLLVGVGTRIANGCTSGHGVCGISRFSWRGLVATVFYIGAGGVTFHLLARVWGVI